MKIDSNVYSEAQHLAKEPHFKYIMLGVVCGVVVPTMYARRYMSSHSGSRPNGIVERLPSLESAETVKPKRSLIDDELTYELYSSII